MVRAVPIHPRSQLRDGCGRRYSPNTYFEINAGLLHRWRKEFQHGPGNAFPGIGKRRWEETRVAQLERKVGQQTVEIDFLKGCLQRIEEQRMLQALTGKPRPVSSFKTRSRKASK
jgi:hypothetical protein